MDELVVKINKKLGNFSLRIDTSFPLNRYNVIIGPSGSGKTLTLRAIAGLEKGDSLVIYKGKDLSSLPPQKRSIGYIPQGDSLFPHLNVYKNIVYGYRPNNPDKDPFFSKIIENLKIKHLLERRVTTLSAGEKQRVTIARALLHNPAILLLDEPLSSLDFHLKLDSITFLKEVFTEFQITFIHVTHDPIEAQLLGEYITVIENGEIIFRGNWNQLTRETPSAFTRKITSIKIST